MCQLALIITAIPLAGAQDTGEDAGTAGLVFVALEYGNEVMLNVHVYLGTFLFLGWNLLFWFPLLYYMKNRKDGTGEWGKGLSVAVA